MASGSTYMWTTPAARRLARPAQVDDILAQMEIVAGFLDSSALDARQSLSRRGARPPVTPV
ncbi:hypothetical protein [Micromonospora sp. NBC_00860]|uniref:hypothetical protein n=1 Tax=Micromonospora sp. NBC_00860 TaxID=2975980 RepID=UPI00386C4E48|nr:hypothetical protein OH804_07765 [Micromonospora sp. NBC_00860]WTA65203.1 hypothetical protein OHB51_22100 [Micromonospora sp. NBC_00855]